MIYEIRFYHVVPGRLDVTYARFGQHLPAIFARHGIRNVGSWTVSAGPNGPTFLYLVAYRDLGERERQWAAFYQDEAWHRVRAATQGDEEAVERFDLFFLRPNPLWTPTPSPAGETLGGVHDLIFSEIAPGQNAAAYQFLNESYLPAIDRLGGRVMMLADFVSGPSLPRLATLVAWPDAVARQEAWRSISGDPELTDAIARQRRRLGRALLGSTETYLLEPTPFALPLATLGNPIAE